MKEAVKKETTKSCPSCGNTMLLKLATLNRKVCVDHEQYVVIPWFIEEGQEPLYPKHTR
jgi:hypothetical protein